MVLVRKFFFILTTLAITYTFTAFIAQCHGTELARFGLDIKGAARNNKLIDFKSIPTPDFETTRSSPYSFVSRALNTRTVISILTEHESKNIPWSDKLHVVEKSDGVRIYHNYTTFVDSQGLRQTRYLRVQDIFRPKNLLSRRGFSANPNIDPAQVKYNVENAQTDPYRFGRIYTWAWRRPGPDCPVAILYGGTTRM